MPVTNNFSFPHIEQAARRLADDMAACLGSALAKRGRASLAVSGGRTPEAVFPILAAADLAWANVHITLIDERWVPVGHADSNEGLARRLLLTGPAASAKFTGLKTDDAEPATGCAEAEKRLAKIPWPLDAVFLGMGPDGHIASLFPGEDWVGAPGRVVGVTQTDDRQARISLTPRALFDSRRIFLIYAGPDKQAVYEKALVLGSASQLPVRLALHQESVPLAVYAVP